MDRRDFLMRVGALAAVPASFAETIGAKTMSDEEIQKLTKSKKEWKAILERAASIAPTDPPADERPRPWVSGQRR